MDSIHPLKAFREKQAPRLTQERLADLLGVSIACVSRWETGARKVKQENLQKVVTITGIPANQLRPDLAALLRAAEAAE